jgi:2'-5' RNA ligase
MTRLFVGLDLAIPVVEQLTLVQDELERRLKNHASPKLVEPENIHLTLKFLGETDPAMIPVLARTLTHLTRPLFPFEFRTVGCGAFPTPQNARIIWAGLDPQGAEIMALLNQTLERDLEEIGIAPDAREFQPHITLARLRAQTPVDATRFLVELKSVDFGTTYVRELVLFASELGKEGPLYRVVQRFALGES